MSNATWFAPADDPAADRKHGDLLALDPSIASPGVALARDGLLISSGRVKLPDLKALPSGQRCLRVAQEIAAWHADESDGRPVRTIVFEWPQWYAREKSKGDPNQLAGLVGVGMALATLLSAQNVRDGVRPPELVTPLPAEWTGQLPKSKTGSAWLSPRGARIKAELRPGELRVAVDQHDVVDAIGLFLYAVRRYGPRLGKVFAGAV